MYRQGARQAIPVQLNRESVRLNANYTGDKNHVDQAKVHRNAFRI